MYYHAATMKERVCTQLSVSSKTPGEKLLSRNHDDSMNHDEMLAASQASQQLTH
jgi:hypothetical protein